MFKNIPWKRSFLYACAILFGIVLGPFVSGLPGWLQEVTTQPTVAQAAEAFPLAIRAPDSPDATHICTPAYIGVFSNRIHVRCTVAATERIIYFASPTSDSKNAARMLSVLLTAKSLAKNLQIYYTATASGASYGCQTFDCRPIDAIEILN